MEENKIQHKSKGYGPHDGDCPACIQIQKDWNERAAQLVNPHRVGTKVYAQWEKDNRRMPWYLDLRSEAYWSM